MFFRWYFELQEMKRLVVLQVSVERFQEEYPGVKRDEILDEEDWKNIRVYVASLQTLSNASDLLEGDTYPTASSVIPYLDQVRLEYKYTPLTQVMASLTDLVARLQGADKEFPRCLLKNLQTSTPKRFPLGYKLVSPFNSLTFADPR
jgi:hypothetical protein